MDFRRGEKNASYKCICFLKNSGKLGFLSFALKQVTQIHSYLFFLTAVPSVPRSFRIMHRHYDTIYLDWEEPAEPNGILIGYILKYQTCEHISAQ